jgi:hypothetical protein
MVTIRSSDHRLGFLLFKDFLECHLNLDRQILSPENPDVAMRRPRRDGELR